ncbi:hypothetical protein NYE57_07300 [Bacillus sp. FSL L8-0222]|uniref:hypothetical protein n=1 Tax=Bacillus TaxID=1386 RepID=UPI00164A43B8|nr:MULTISPECIES: hypothetical protein [Bacillus subtilis group]MEC1620111.1 hypothetical protein [Bacillus mojavensis]MEC1658589.1 hypothetical protein [Bacillus mojavensis]QNK35649.1 hypothetical protein H8S71_13765 [Bacillus subtilis subsp. subtilis]QPZ44100.1 hypothetical protein I7X10_09890 [Bacillus halotolerans]
MTKVNNQLIDNLANALGVHTLLDDVLDKLDNKTINDIVNAIMLEHGLEVTK